MLILVGTDFALGLSVRDAGVSPACPITLLKVQARDVKSDGWQWQKTRLRQPDRAERHWLAMAVALLWMVTLGGEQESFHDEELISDLSKTPQLTATRQISCFLNGLLTIVAQLLNNQSLTFGRLFPISFNHFSDWAFSDSS